MSTATKVKVDELVEIVKSMTMIEVSEFVKKLEEEFGVSSQMPVMASVAQSTAGGEDADAPVEQTEFTVILQSAGSSKIPVIKEVRAITGLGLKDTKELVEAGGKAVKENISKEEAEQIKQKLEAVGATVELK